MFSWCVAMIKLLIKCVREMWVSLGVGMQHPQGCDGGHISGNPVPFLIPFSLEGHNTAWLQAEPMGSHTGSTGTARVEGLLQLKVGS